VRSQGFVIVEETLNAVEAWLSSLPANAMPMSVNAGLVAEPGHMLPLSALWAGPERNAHLDGPPLLVARTAGSTPFRMVLHRATSAIVSSSGRPAPASRRCWR